MAPPEEVQDGHIRMEMDVGQAKKKKKKSDFHAILK